MESLAALIDNWAAADPAAPAICHEGRAIGVAALAAESRRVAGGLARLGVGPGDRVAVFLPNGPAWLALLFGCARLGAMVVAVNTRFRSGEVADILGRSGAKVLALAPRVKSSDFAAILAEVPAADLEALETVIACEDNGAASIRLAGRPTLGYGELAASPPLGTERGDQASPAVVFTTSGTTKAPKFVLHLQRSLAAHARDVARGFGYDAPGTVTLGALPLCGTFGLAQTLATFAARRPIVLQRTFDAAEAAALITGHGVTTFNASDEMLLRLFEAAEGERPFPSWQWSGYANFNSSIADLPQRAARRGVVLRGLWGSSEMQALYAIQRTDDPAEMRGAPGGVPVSPEARFRIRDPDSGRLQGDGEPGELETAGPSRMAEYLGDPAATAEALTEDGYVRMGDLAYRRPDGSFVFQTRLGDVLRLGGWLVAPAEIEDRLQSHPSIAAAQVVGAESAEGSRAVAFVIPRPNAALDEKALQAHCVAALARFKVPARIVALDAFPVTQSANGEKIQRAKLREMARAALAASQPRR